MCGRYTLFSEADNPELLGIIREIERKYGPGAVSAGEVFPSGRAPILIAAEGRTCPELGTWGFPRPGTGGLVINARAETAAEKRMFSESLLRRRCAVPCAGFYEWDAAKTKYLFRLPQEPCLYLAGLYGEFGGVRRYVVLTTAANAPVRDVHTRMPVILPRDAREAWMHDAAAARAWLGADMPLLAREAADGQQTLF